jgi:hypothetical protein
MSRQKSFNRIMITDDDSTSAYLTNLTLTEMEIGEQILTAYNGKEGIEIIKQYCLNQHAAKVECPDLKGGIKQLYQIKRTTSCFIHSNSTFYFSLLKLSNIKETI